MLLYIVSSVRSLGMFCYGGNLARRGCCALYLGVYSYSKQLQNVLQQKLAVEQTVRDLPQSV